MNQKRLYYSRNKSGLVTPVPVQGSSECKLPSFLNSFSQVLQQRFRKPQTIPIQKPSKHRIILKKRITGLRKPTNTNLKPSPPCFKSKTIRPPTSSPYFYRLCVDPTINGQRIDVKELEWVDEMNRLLFRFEEGQESWNVNQTRFDPLDKLV